MVELPASGDTVTTRDSDVTGAAWLEGDRWAILAAPNETAGIVDFSDRKISPLGSGRTKDLSNPTTLFVSQDSLYIGDWGHGAHHRLDPSGPADPLLSEPRMPSAAHCRRPGTPRETSIWTRLLVPARTEAGTGTPVRFCC